MCQASLSLVQDECEAWGQQAMPERSMGITGTVLETASHIPEEAIASKDGLELLSAPC